jgi:hypothetical protein
MRKDLAAELTAATNAPGTGLAMAALAIARIEYPRLDLDRYLTRLDEMGAATARPVPGALVAAVSSAARSFRIPGPVLLWSRTEPIEQGNR